jgi:hypothetical protein
LLVTKAFLFGLAASAALVVEREVLRNLRSRCQETIREMSGERVLGIGQP